MTHDEEALLLMRVDDLWNRMAEVTQVLKMYNELTNLLHEDLIELRSLSNDPR